MTDSPVQPDILCVTKFQHKTNGLAWHNETIDCTPLCVAWLVAYADEKTVQRNLILKYVYQTTWISQTSWEIWRITSPTYSLKGKTNIRKSGIFRSAYVHDCRPAQPSRYSDSQRAGGSRDRIPVGGGGFSASFQTGPGAQPASCTMETVSLSRGVKRPNRGVAHPPTSSAKVSNTSLLPSWPVLGRTM
jgi:hypothetical protein